MNASKSIVWILAALWSTCALAQEENESKKVKGIKAPEQIEIDGKIQVLPRGSVAFYPEENIMVDKDGRIHEFKDPARAAAELMQVRVDANLSELEMFATQHHFHGVPYEEAVKFRGEDYSGLVRMLADPQWEGYWIQMVEVLAIVGDESVTEHLIEFIETDKPSATRSMFYRAQLVAIAALGYVVDNHQSQRAFDYLESSLKPGKGDKLMQAHNRSPDPDRQLNDFQMSALRGLMISRSDKAISLLEKHRSMLKAQSKNRNTAAGKDANLDSEDQDVQLVESYIVEAKRRKANGHKRKHDFE